ncbi:MAG TPA: DUF2934 domain-containing protein [Gammaproteobacteria bacterium]
MATKPCVSVTEREKMIAEAAYFRALESRFRNRDPVDDWLEAEREIDAKFDVAPHDQKLAHLYEELAEINERVRVTAAKLKAEARAEWREEVERIHKLRDAFSEKLDEIYGRTGQARQQAKHQAEKLRQELADTLKRLGTYPR